MIWEAEEILNPDWDGGTAGAYFLFEGPDAEAQARQLVQLAAAAKITVKITPRETIDATVAFSRLWQHPANLP